MFQKIQRLTATAAILFLSSLGYSAHPSPNAENAPLIGPGKYKDFRLEKPTDSTKQGENWMRYAPSKTDSNGNRIDLHSTVKGQRNQSLPLKDVDFSQY